MSDWNRMTDLFGALVVSGDPGIMHDIRRALLAAVRKGEPDHARRCAGALAALVGPFHAPLPLYHLLTEWIDHGAESYLPLYHLLTEWIDHGAESYRLAMPTREAIHSVGADGADKRSWCAKPVVRCTPIGWTVWTADRSRIIASGRETGPEARRLADEAATKAGWILT